MNLFKHLTYLISIFLLAYSCKKQEIAQEEHQLYIPETDFNYYFPLQTDSLELRGYPDQQGKLHPDINRWFSEYLQKMEEPNLFKLKDSGFIIRLTVFGDSDEYRIHRLEKKNHKWTIHFKVKFRNEEGEFIFNNIVYLTDQSKLNNFEKKINEFEIRNYPTFNESGLDGETYILEVYKDGQYNFIERWSPREEDEKEFLEISKLIEDLYSKK